MTRPASTTAATVRLAWWNITGLRRRLRTFLVFVSIASGVTVAVFAIGDSAAATQRTQASAGTLRSIEVQQSPSSNGHNILTPDDVTTLTSLPGVESVQPVLQTTVGIKTPPIMGVILYPTTARSVSPPPVIAATRPQIFPLTGDDIVLPATTQGQDLRPLLGMTVPVTLTPRHGDSGGMKLVNAHVVGLYNPSWQVDGQYAAYASQQTLTDWAATNDGLSVNDYLTQVGYNGIIVVARSTDAVNGLLSQVQDKGFYASSLLQVESDLPSVFQLVRVAGQTGGVLLGLLVVVMAGALAGSLTRQRIREFALLRAVGYRRGAVLRLLLVEQFFLGVACAAGAVVVAVAATQALTMALRRLHSLTQYLPGGLVFPPLRFVAAAVVALVVIVAVAGLPAARRAARLEPSAGLRDV